MPRRMRLDCHQQRKALITVDQFFAPGLKKLRDVCPACGTTRRHDSGCPLHAFTIKQVANEIGGVTMEEREIAIAAFLARRRRG